MNKFLLFTIIFVVSCSNDLVEKTSLASYLEDREVVLDNVIACAASNELDDLVSVFLFPRPNATNIKYFEAISSTIDKNSFDQYEQFESPLIYVFNGFLKKFEVSVNAEKWVIVSFEEDNKIHIANPIRIKNQTKPTEYISSNISIEEETINPLITWEDGLYDDTRIYFQVLTDSTNNLISGTYTFDSFFKYYDLENVVLNITPGTPQNLKLNSTYSFSLLGVSEDNWVNIFSIKSFVP